MPLLDVTLHDEAITCRFSGVVTREDSQAFVDRCRPLLVGARFIVIDFTAMTRYDADIRHVAREAMMQWRAYGIELVLGISESHVARILGTTLGVATNLPLRFVGSVEEAAARLSSMRQHPRPQGAPR